MGTAKGFNFNTFLTANSMTENTIPKKSRLVTLHKKMNLISCLITKSLPRKVILKYSGLVKLHRK